MSKQIVTGQEAKQRLLDGVNTAAEVVGSTIGPAGRNVLIGKKFKKPWITNDGVSIANEIDLEDPVADLGARTLLEVAMQTNEKAGDGTTTSTVLAHAIIKKALTSNTSFTQQTTMGLYRQLKADLEVVLEELKKQTKPIKDYGKLIDVATSSMEDENLGKLVAEVVDKVGVNGYVDIDTHNEPDTKVEYREGLRYDKIGAAGPQFLSSGSDTKLTNPYVLVTNDALNDINQLQTISKQYSELSKESLRPLVIIAPKFSDAVITDIFHANQVGLNVTPVKAGALKDG
jgi:chaperonin GroEL